MTTPLNPLDREAWEKRLNEIEARADAATPGPWGICMGSGGNLCTALSSEGFEDWDRRFTPIADFLPDWILEAEDGKGGSSIRKDHRQDMDFVAHSRQDIPDLVAYARALQSQLTEAQAEVERLRGIAQVASRYVQAERDALSAQERWLSRQDVGDFEVKMDGAWTNICVAVDEFNAIEKARQPK